jgi:hypothetical protein
MLLLLSTSLMVIIYFENSMKKHEIKNKYIQTKNIIKHKNSKKFESTPILSTNQMK